MICSIPIKQKNIGLQPKPQKSSLIAPELGAGNRWDSNDVFYQRWEKNQPPAGLMVKTQDFHHVSPWFTMESYSTITFILYI